MRHFLDDTVASWWFLEYPYMDTQVRILRSNTLAISRFWSNANSSRMAFQRFYYGYNTSNPHHPAFAMALSSAGALPRNDPATNRIVQQRMTQNIGCVFVCDTNNRNMSGNLSESQQSPIFRIDVQLTQSLPVTTPHHSIGTHLVCRGVPALAMAPPSAAAPHSHVWSNRGLFYGSLFVYICISYISFRIVLHCNSFKFGCNTLQHTTIHCNTLQ